jgi:hypothetical protein
MARDEFTALEKAKLLEINAGIAKSRWPERFGTRCRTSPRTGFVGDKSEVFEVDHVWPCNLGTSSH